MPHRARDDLQAAPPDTYDVLLRGCPVDVVLSRHPEVRVRTTEPQTALRCVSGPTQLDALLRRLRSVGLVLMDVHRASELPGVPASGDVYEVRVKGVLGAPLLQYLHWPHYVVPAETQVRIASASADLHAFLKDCTDAGAGIERVRRVDGAWARERASA